jgi:hypothetical protein
MPATSRKPSLKTMNDIDQFASPEQKAEFLEIIDILYTMPREPLPANDHIRAILCMRLNEIALAVHQAGWIP